MASAGHLKAFWPSVWSRWKADLNDWLTELKRWLGSLFSNYPAREQGECNETRWKPPVICLEVMRLWRETGWQALVNIWVQNEGEPAEFPFIWKWCWGRQKELENNMVWDLIKVEACWVEKSVEEQMGAWSWRPWCQCGVPLHIWKVCQASKWRY